MLGAMPEKKNRRIGRRSVLKTVGAGFGAVSIVGSAHAEQSPWDVYRQSLKLKNETGSVETWRNFLRDNGHEVATNRTENKAKLSSDDGDVSTQRYYDTNITFDLTLTELCDSVYVADLTWEYDPLAEDDIRTPDLPKDQAALYWDTTKWKPHGDQNYYSSNIGTDNRNVEDYGYTLLRGDTPPSNGIKFDVLAHHAANIGDIADGIFFIGQQIEPIGDYSEDARDVSAQYAINYSGGSIDSVGLSYPQGLTVNASWSTKTSYVAYNGTGTDKKFLDVYQNNAKYNCRP